MSLSWRKRWTGARSEFGPNRAPRGAESDRRLTLDGSFGTFARRREPAGIRAATCRVA
jgi:hypothetical protein